MSAKIFVIIFWLAAVTVAAVILKLLFSVVGVVAGLGIVTSVITIVAIMVKRTVLNFTTEE